MDPVARIDAVRSVLLGHLDALVILHLVVLAILAVLSTRVVLEPFRRAGRASQLGIPALMALGFALHAFYIPALSRHVFDGHEADYFDVWRGVRTGLEHGYRASELLRVVYRWGGPFFNGTARSLVGLQLLISLLIVPFAWLWVRDLTGSERAGLWTAWFLVIDPILGFWASSAYNIQLPFVLGLMSLAVLERAVRRGSTVMLALSLALWATAVATRTELLLLGLPLAWRIVQHHRIVASHRGWLAALLLPLLLIGIDLMAGPRSAVGGDSMAYFWSMFRRQALLFDFLRPWSTPAGVLAIVAGAAVVWRLARASRGLLALWAAMGLSHHLAYALFDDYDFRHTLVPRLALAALVGTALGVLGDVDALTAGGWWPRARRGTALSIALALSLPLASGLRDISSRYYATAAQFYRDEPRFQTAPEVDLEPYKGCLFVVENYWYQQRFAHASHFDLFDEQKLSRLEEKYHGCILFVYDLENYQASSRSIDGRALKVDRFFKLSLRGKRVERRAERYALIFALSRPSPAP